MRANVLLADLLKSTCKPKVILPADEWVEEHVRLDPKSSPTIGKYRLNHTPYLRRLYQDVSNPRIRKIVLKKAAQVGATQFASNVLLYYVCNFLFPLLMIMPSKEAAQQFCERCLTPSIAQCREVQKHLTGNPDDQKKTEFLFDSCIARVIGAGSPSKLASNPACICIIDEADKMDDFSSIGEAPALELAEDRTIAFPTDKKIIVSSTPTEENLSVVHSQFLLGSQSKYFVRCPRCQHAQTLAFAQVKWPDGCKDEAGNYDLDRIEREAFYECEGCGAHLTEQDKTGMVRAGEWRDTNPKPFPAEIRSYQISALYSFNVTFGGLAKLFLLSKDDPGKLRNFYNSYLGECFQQRAETIKPTDIDEVVKRSPAYVRGELLQRPDVILMATDVQGATLYYSVEAVYPDGSSAVIDWGQAATWEDLVIVANRQYQIKGTEEYVGIYKCLVDSGYKTDQVYDLAVKSTKFLPVKGTSAKQQIFEPTRDSSIDYRSKRIPLLIIHDSYWKDHLYISTIKEGMVKWYLPQDLDPDFRRQLSSEHKVEKKEGGRLITQWRAVGRFNHWGDTSKYICAFKYRLAPQLEQMRKKAAAPPEPPKRQYTLQQPAYVDGWS